MVISKVCTKCKEVKDSTEFRKQASNKDGLQYECKECINKRGKARYDAKKDHIIQKNIEWQNNHRGTHNKTARKYYYSINARLGRGLKKVIKSCLGLSSIDTKQFIGIDLDGFVAYIETKLPQGFLLSEYEKRWVLAFKEAPVDDSVLDNPEQISKYLDYNNLETVEKLSRKHTDFGGLVERRKKSLVSENS